MNHVFVDHSVFFHFPPKTVPAFQKQRIKMICFVVNPLEFQNRNKCCTGGAFRFPPTYTEKTQERSFFGLKLENGLKRNYLFFAAGMYSVLRSRSGSGLFGSPGIGSGKILDPDPLSTNRAPVILTFSLYKIQFRQNSFLSLI